MNSWRTERSTKTTFWTSKDNSKLPREAPVITPSPSRNYRLRSRWGLKPVVGICYIRRFWPGNIWNWNPNIDLKWQYQKKSKIREKPWRKFMEKKWKPEKTQKPWNPVKTRENHEKLWKKREKKTIKISWKTLKENFFQMLLTQKTQHIPRNFKQLWTTNPEDVRRVTIPSRGLNVGPTSWLSSLTRLA